MEKLNKAKIAIIWMANTKTSDRVNVLRIQVHKFCSLWILCAGCFGQKE